MEFNHLEAFRTAARAKSFKGAALLLGVVQSAISTRIKGLEEELNVKLFDRNGRGVELTSAGNELLNYADRIFAVREEAEQAIKFKDRIQGEITVAGSESILTYRIPSILHEFKMRYPDVRIKMIPASVTKLKSLLLQGEIDVAYILEEEFKISELNTFRLSDERVVVVASNHNPLVNRDKVTASDLKDQNILFTEKGCNYRNRFERCLINAGSYSKTDMEFMSIETIKACVKLNTGVAAISAVSVHRELAEGDLVALNWEGSSLDVQSYIVWSNNRWLSPSVKAYIELNKELTMLESL